jgi:hypothetical protein
MSKTKSQSAICDGCGKIYHSLRSITGHWQKNKECANASNTNTFTANSQETSSKEIEEQCFPIGDDNSYSSDSIITENDNHKPPSNVNMELMQMQKEHEQSNDFSYQTTKQHLKANVKLLHILKQAKVPLYLFDQVLDWAKDAAINHNVDFKSNNLLSRSKTLQHLKKKYRLHEVEPKIKTIMLPGCKCHIDLIIHDFKSSLYSLLNDASLMQIGNLLLNPDDIFDNSQCSADNNGIFNDINSGSCYQMAIQTYIQSSNELLCPIIFFIDKTHTDVHGRLCLEPIRFTLGIFNRTTRNNPLAWRTLGYIYDQNNLPTKNAHFKSMDYHHMMSIILKDLKECQNQSLQWHIKIDKKIYNVYLRIPVMFIIGDTEGHDKIAGRYLARANIQRLCRYCNCPKDSTDDPFVLFTYNKHKSIMRKVANAKDKKNRKHELQALSMQGIDNAWGDIQFCDSTRGLFGALCGDLMHCLQHGLFMYLVVALFNQKELKKTSGSAARAAKNEEPEIMTKKSVFGDTYCLRFDPLCRDYGKMLMHQSARDLPRTHFNSSYSTIAKKNSNEMSGILLVYLFVFNSSESKDNIDEKLGEGRTTKWIQVIESMLLLEHFCNQEAIPANQVRTLKRYIPYILEQYKVTLDRQVGCQMKIPKFHLPLHFADDIMRFGTMKNFNTGVGESHHKTESKMPAKNTQRRRSNFDFQTASRQVENLACSMANNNYLFSDKTNACHDGELNKWFRYTFDKKKKYVIINKTRRSGGF